MLIVLKETLGVQLVGGDVGGAEVFPEGFGEVDGTADEVLSLACV